MIKIIIGIYAVLTLTAVVVQLKGSRVSYLTGLIMFLGGLLMLSSLIISNVAGILLLTIGLSLAHISAMTNGFRVYGTIDKKHHTIRFLISIIIILFYVWSL